LLRPQGLVPKENQVAETLGSLLGDLWGPFGFWFMVAIVFITFCSTVLSVEDGFERMFANGTQILLQGFGVRGRWTNEKFLQRVYIGMALRKAKIVETAGEKEEILGIAFRYLEILLCNPAPLQSLRCLPFSLT
jgi:hypothetical protein